MRFKSQWNTRKSVLRLMHILTGFTAALVAMVIIHMMRFSDFTEYFKEGVTTGQYLWWKIKWVFLLFPVAMIVDFFQIRFAHHKR